MMYYSTVGVPDQGVAIARPCGMASRNRPTVNTLI